MTELILKGYALRVLRILLGVTFICGEHYKIMCILHRNNPHTIDKLKDNIRTEIRKITEENFGK